MNVNFEFYDEEVVENIISCMNYRFDKVVFCGYSKTINKGKKYLETFLKEKCKIKEIAYIDDLSPNDLEYTVRK